MSRFTGHVAVITGSTDGIGFAIAERLAKEGCHVVISSRREQNVKDAVNKLLADGLSAVGVVCHVGKEDHRQRLVQTALKSFGKGHVDILVNNVAVSPAPGSLTDMDGSVWDKLFDLNVKAALLMTKECVPHMREGGSVVFVSSVAGFTPRAPLSAYGITKTALFGLTRALSLELGYSHKIRVNCVAPGLIRTRFSELLWKNPELKKDMLKDCPLERIGEGEDIAGPVAFLCSSDAAYVSGETIVVAGGAPVSRL